MKTIRIGKNNSTYQQIVAIKENRNKRAKTGCFFVEGIQNIKDAISNKWEIEAFIFSNSTILSRWAQSVIHYAKTNYIIDDVLMKNLCDKTDTCELLAIVNMKSPLKDNQININNPIYVLLDRPSKKGNMGTIIRSCDAFGVSKIFYSGHSVDLYDANVITASMGSFFKIPISFIPSNNAFIETINELKSIHHGLKIIATSLQASKNIFDCDMKMPILLLVGNESDGLSQFYMDICNESVKIPMNGQIDSLNVACATTACLYEAYRQRFHHS